MAPARILGNFALALLFMIPTASIAEGTHEEDPTSGAKGTWEEVAHKEGIKVWRLDIPGETLPGFRGEGTIAAPAAAVLREIQRVEHHTEWMDRCAEARRIETIDQNTHIVYNRTDSPWPAWDRDVVVKTTVSRANDGKELKLSFQNTDAGYVPPQDGVVRMPRLEGAYTMTQVGPNETHVSYQVEVDIGGVIPGWIASMIARDLPVKTLSALRERVESMATEQQPEQASAL
ncbi:START domain-containing protein [Hydrocarboniclastica marina]|uniref:START domain-containing protein n=1 Tax=Hydrocarboniclastica marina TaxID=2259620 RepID=A0A4P7XKJ8_9ALTE|nr:START domain-containing protein [Hydrocarboniclastica marina]QCF27661.1 hypothetical protein soil367_17985 [Hydrocarboniclastica marina]